MGKGGRVWARIAIAAISVCVVVFVGLPAWHRHGREMRSTTASMRRLHQIGLALLLYQQDHGDVFPDTLDKLAAAEHLPADCLPFCPPDDDADDADDAGDPRWPYVYLGRGRRPSGVNATTGIAYEPPAYNDGRGSDVLFGDGHTEWVDIADLPRRLAAGRPATGPSSRPASAAGILLP